MLSLGILSILTSCLGVSLDQLYEVSTHVPLDSIPLEYSEVKATTVSVGLRIYFVCH
jgi:hypothetical protein